MKIEAKTTSYLTPHTSYLIPFLLFSFLLFPLNSSAQSKFAHVDYGEVMKNMPGIDSAQIIAMNYAAELQAIGEQMVKEFKEKEEAFDRLAATPNTSPAILKIRQDELGAIVQRIREFSQSMEVDIQDKQLELLEPFQTKLLDAIKKVAKASNYNYVFDTSTLMFYSPTDDLTDKVKAELGIK